MIVIESVLDAIKALSEKIDAALSAKPKYNHRSEDINLLFGALAKAQGDMKPAPLNKSNPFFKSRYADFESIVMASREPLAKNGLSVLQNIIKHDDESSVLHTILGHSSGQWMASTIRILPPKNDIQSMSSYTTYLKRMAYAALIGVVTGDEDDDGEIAMQESRNSGAKGVALNHKYDAREQSPDPITPEQYEELEYELSSPGCEDIAKQILEGLRINALSDMPKSKWSASLKRIRDIKALRGLK